MYLDKTGDIFFSVFLHLILLTIDIHTNDKHSIECFKQVMDSLR